MSTINSKNVQVGTSSTAAENFTLYQPATPDGTVRLGVGNSGATTGDVVTVNSSGVTVTGTLAATSISASGASLTNLNASNLSSGTVATARLATGTANSTTYLRGDQTWATVTSLPGMQGQVFTSSGTFTVPSGITAVKVTVIGGGGGGGGSSGGCGSGSGGGGGGGGTSIRYVTGLTPGGTVSVTIGAAGSASSGSGSGGSGGASSFGAFATGNGGSGGGGGPSGGSGGAGANGTASGGDINLTGYRQSTSSRGGGAAHFLSQAYDGISPGNDVNGTTGGGYGAGGSGSQSNATRSGAAGTAGIVIVEW